MKVTFKTAAIATAVGMMVVGLGYFNTSIASGTIVQSASLYADSTIKVHGKTDRNGYGHLYLLPASGTAVVVRENVPISSKADLNWKIHGPSTKTTSFGKDRVIFVVTNSKLKGFAGTKSIHQQYLLDIDEAAFRKALKAKTNRLSSNEWTIAEATIVTAK